MKYPFLFHKSVDDPDDRNTVENKWIVKIAKCFDYVGYKSAWMDDELLGNHCLVPDVDICESAHEFDSEEEAIEFIRQWWRKN